MEAWARGKQVSLSVQLGMMAGTHHERYAFSDVVGFDMWIFFVRALIKAGKWKPLNSLRMSRESHPIASSDGERNMNMAVPFLRSN